MSPRRMARIIVTTDVHSALNDPAPLLAYLHAARPDALIADCGDFVEGSGYYRLGHGRVERQILHELYDVIAPGNHGWKHHFEPGLWDRTVNANAVDRFGRLLFTPLRFFTIAGTTTAVTAVISAQAFDAIPAADRDGQQITDPVDALTRLYAAHRHQANAWIVLSHSGFADDLDLAERCRFPDVVFAGHCHSPSYGPDRVGHTLVVKGPELAAGYAVAEPHAEGWTAASQRFPAATAVPRALADIARQLRPLHSRLSAPLDQIAPPWRARIPDRKALTAAAVDRIHDRFVVPAVLNETALRPARLGDTLCLGDLLAVEPFGNRLVCTTWPTGPAERTALLARLTDRAGPLVLAPAPLPESVSSVITTDYLAEAVAEEYGGQALDTGLSLGHLLRLVLTTPATTGEPS